MHRKTIVGAVAVAAVFLTAMAPRIARSTDEYFQSDVADYMRAAKVGFWGLYADFHTATLASWYSWSKSNPQFKAHPFDYLYEINDVASLRHYHGPGSMYFLAITGSLGLGEEQQRILLGLIGSLSYALLAWLLWRLGAGLPLAIGAGILAALDLRNIATDLEPNPPHTIYIFLTMIFFVLALEWVLRGRPNWLLYAGAGVLAMATVTFELVVAIWISLIVGLFVAVWRQKIPLRDWAHPALRFLAAYLVTLILLWPGGFASGSFVLCFVGNLTIFRRLHLSASVPLMSVFENVFHGYQLYVLLLAFVAVAAIAVLGGFVKNKERPEPLPVVFACYAVLAAMFGVSSHFWNVQYLTQTMVPVFLVSGLLVHLASARLGNWFRIAVAAVLFAAVGLNVIRLRNTSFQPSEYRQVVADLRKTARSDDGIVLVNDINALMALRLYLPDYRFEMCAAPSQLTPRHPAAESSIRRALLNEGLMDAATTQEAKTLFPMQSAYRMNGKVAWLGNRK
jgi:hypothetical protein